MGVITEQRALRLPPELFAALEQLAVETNSVAKRGPRARLHSWHVMVERIAKGEIIIQEKNPWSLPAGLAEAADKIEREQREQERLEDQQSLSRRERIAAHPKQAQKTPLKMQQLNMLELEPA